MTRFLPLLLCLILPACASSNTLRIGPGAEPLEIGSDGVFINSGLLGLEGQSIDVDTNGSNDLNISISGRDTPRNAHTTGAF